MKKLYVGNLSYSTNEAGLRQAFEGYSSVASVKIISDKYTGQSRGFGFVEMDDDDEAERAIQEVNGITLDGKSLKVNEARPQTDRGGAGSSRGGYGRSSGRSGHAERY